jgi:hypothetical protein
MCPATWPSPGCPGPWTDFTWLTRRRCRSRTTGSCPGWGRGCLPAHRRAKVLAIAVVGFERGRIRSQRILWDHATLISQLRIPGPAAAG